MLAASDRISRAERHLAQVCEPAYLAEMRYAFAAVVLAVSITSALAAGRIPYGSRVGMEATVVGVERIGTANAVIRVKHTRENAKEFCVEYSDDNSEDCVRKTLREVRINDELRGNCRTGQFTTLWGDALRFAGANRRKGGDGPKYVLVGVNGPLEGNMASGYYTALAEFNALCPGLAGTDP